MKRNDEEQFVKEFRKLIETVMQQEDPNSFQTLKMQINFVYSNAPQDVGEVSCFDETMYVPQSNVQLTEEELYNLVLSNHQRNQYALEFQLDEAIDCVCKDNEIASIPNGWDEGIKELICDIIEGKQYYDMIDENERRGILIDLIQSKLDDIIYNGYNDDLKILFQNLLNEAKRPVECVKKIRQIRSQTKNPQ
jgi:hypothetical protein